jgi:ABC-type amino acid transport substrate-binding protein
MIHRLFICFLFLLPALGYAASKGNQVTITTLTDFPPNCFKKPGVVEKLEETLPPGADSSQLQGFSWDVVRESFHSSGYTIRLIVAPWSRAMFYIKNGRSQLIFPALKTIMREKVFHYSTETVDQTNILIYVEKSNTLSWPNFNILSGKRIATVRGWSYGKKWEMMTDVIRDPASTMKQGFYMLENARVFGVIGYEDSFDYWLKREGSFEKYTKSPTIESVADYIIGLKSPAVIKLISDFDKGKRALMQSGRMRDIYSRWAASGIILPPGKTRGAIE